MANNYSSEAILAVRAIIQANAEELAKEVDSIITKVENKAAINVHMALDKDQLNFIHELRDQLKTISKTFGTLDKDSSDFARNFQKTFEVLATGTNKAELNIESLQKALSLLDEKNKKNADQTQKNIKGIAEEANNAKTWFEKQAKSYNDLIEARKYYNSIMSDWQNPKNHDEAEAFKKEAYTTKQSIQLMTERRDKMLKNMSDEEKGLFKQTESYRMYTTQIGLAAEALYNLHQRSGYEGMEKVLGSDEISKFVGLMQEAKQLSSFNKVNVIGFENLLEIINNLNTSLNNMKNNLRLIASGFANIRDEQGNVVPNTSNFAQLVEYSKQLNENFLNLQSVISNLGSINNLQNVVNSSEQSSQTVKTEEESIQELEGLIDKLIIKYKELQNVRNEAISRSGENEFGFYTYGYPGVGDYNHLDEMDGKEVKDLAKRYVKELNSSEKSITDEIYSFCNALNTAYDNGWDILTNSQRTKLQEFFMAYKSEFKNYDKNIDGGLSEVFVSDNLENESIIAFKKLGYECGKDFAKLLTETIGSTFNPKVMARALYAKITDENDSDIKMIQTQNQTPNNIPVSEPKKIDNLKISGEAIINPILSENFKKDAEDKINELGINGNTTLSPLLSSNFKEDAETKIGELNLTANVKINPVVDSSQTIQTNVPTQEPEGFNTLTQVHEIEEIKEDFEKIKQEELQAAEEARVFLNTISSVDQGWQVNPKIAEAKELLEAMIKSASELKSIEEHTQFSDFRFNNSSPNSEFGGLARGLSSQSNNFNVSGTNDLDVATLNIRALSEYRDLLKKVYDEQYKYAIEEQKIQEASSIEYIKNIHSIISEYDKLYEKNQNGELVNQKEIDRFDELSKKVREFYDTYEKIRVVMKNGDVWDTSMDLSDWNVRANSIKQIIPELKQVSNQIPALSGESTIPVIRGQEKLQESVESTVDSYKKLLDLLFEIKYVGKSSYDGKYNSDWIGFYSSQEEAIEKNLARQKNNLHSSLNIILSEDKNALESLQAEADKLKASLKPIQDMVSRISLNSSLKELDKNKGSEEWFKRYAEEYKRIDDRLGELQSQYKLTNEELEEYITLQIKAEKIMKVQADRYGGVKHSGAMDTNELNQWIEKSFARDLGLNPDDIYRGLFGHITDALYEGLNGASLYDNNGVKKNLRYIVGELLDYQGFTFSGGYGANEDAEKLNKVNTVLNYIKNNLEEINSIDLSTKMDSVKYYEGKVSEDNTTPAIEQQNKLQGEIEETIKEYVKLREQNHLANSAQNYNMNDARWSSYAESKSSGKQSIIELLSEIEQKQLEINSIDKEDIKIYREKQGELLKLKGTLLGVYDSYKGTRNGSDRFLGNDIVTKISTIESEMSILEKSKVDSGYSKLFDTLTKIEGLNPQVVADIFQRAEEEARDAKYIIDELNKSINEYITNKDKTSSSPSLSSPTTTNTNTPTQLSIQTDNTQQLTKEQDALNSLAEYISNVIELVNNKTSAFEREQQVVEGTVQNEITNLTVLSGWLISLKNDVELLSTVISTLPPIDLKLDLNNFDTSKINEEVATKIKDIGNSLKNIDTSNISSEGIEILNGLNISKVAGENLQKVANAITNIKASLNNLSIGGNAFLEDIKTITSYSEELKALNNILKVTKTEREQVFKKLSETTNNSSSFSASTNSTNSNNSTIAVTPLPLQPIEENSVKATENKIEALKQEKEQALDTSKAETQASDEKQKKTKEEIELLAKKIAFEQQINGQIVSQRGDFGSDEGWSYLTKLEEGQFQSTSVRWDNKAQDFIVSVGKISTSFEEVEKQVLAADKSISQLETKLAKDRLRAGTEYYDTSYAQENIDAKKQDVDYLNKVLQLYSEEAQYGYSEEDFARFTLERAEAQKVLNNQKENQLSIDNAIAKKNADKKAAQEAEKEADALAKSNDYLVKRAQELEKIRQSYIEGGTSQKYIKDSNDLIDLENRHTSIEEEINRLKSKNVALTQQEKTELEQLLNTLELQVRIYRNKEYTPDLSSKDLSSSTEQAKNHYDKLIADMKIAGDYTSDLVKKTEFFKKSLFDVKDSSTLKALTDQLKVFRSEFQKIKSENKLSGLMTDDEKRLKDYRIEFSKHYYQSIGQKPLELQRMAEFYKQQEEEAKQITIAQSEVNATLNREMEAFNKSQKEKWEAFKEEGRIANNAEYIRDNKKAYQELGDAIERYSVLSKRIASSKTPLQEDIDEAQKLENVILNLQNSPILSIDQIDASNRALDKLLNKLIDIERQSSNKTERIYSDSEVTQYYSSAIQKADEYKKAQQELIDAQNKYKQTQSDEDFALLNQAIQARQAAKQLYEEAIKVLNIDGVRSKLTNDQNIAINNAKASISINDKNIRNGEKDPDKVIDEETKKIKNAFDSYQKILDRLSKQSNLDKYQDNYKNKVIELRDQLAQFKQYQNIDIFSDSQKETIKVIDTEVKKLINDIDKISGMERRGNMAKASSVGANISNYLSTLTKSGQLVKDTRRELQGYIEELNSPNITARRINQISEAFANAKIRINEAGKAGRGFMDIFNTKLFYTLAHQLSFYFSFYRIIGYIKSAINTVKELDTALIDLRKTTIMSNSQLEDFYLTSNDLAKKMGVTTAEIINQAAAWSRLGYNTEVAAKKMAELSSQFAAISPGMSTDEAQTGLVSIMKAWDVSPEDVERKIMDNINTLGNKFAESNSDIIAGMERSAATFSALGQSIEDAFALFTGAQEVQQNAETVGTALKTLSLRIRGYSEETEELDDELKNITGDVVNLTKTASNPIGVSLFTDATQTEYRSMVDYLRDISNIWDEIDAKSQTALLDKLFGKRGASVGSALIKNFDSVERALKEMENAGGSADKEMTIIQESLSYKMNEFKQTWVGTIQTLIDRGDLGRLIDNLTKISEVIGLVVNELGLFGTTLISIGLFNSKKIFGNVTSFFSDITNLANMQQKAINAQNALLAISFESRAITDYTILYPKMAEAIKTVDYATQAAILSQNGLAESQIVEILMLNGIETKEEAVAIARGVNTVASEVEDAQTKKSIATKKLWIKTLLQSKVALMTLAGVGIAAVIISISKMNAELEERNDNARKFGEDLENEKESLDKYKEKIVELNKTINEYDSSNDKVIEARKELLKIQDELIKKYKTENDSISLITSSINGQVDALDNLLYKKYQNTKIDYNKSSLFGYINNYLSGAEDNLDYLEKKMNNNLIRFGFSRGQYKNDDYKELIEQLEKFGWTYNKNISSGMFEMEGTAKEIYDNLINLQENIENINIPKSVKVSLNSFTSEYKDFLSDNNDLWNQYILYEKIFPDENLSQYWKNLNDFQNKYTDMIVQGNENAFEESGLSELFENILNDENVDKVVKEYFRDLFPSLNEEFKKYDFKVNIIPNIDFGSLPGIEELKGLTDADIYSYLTTDGPETTGEQAFNRIVESAIEYGLIINDDASNISKLIDLLIEWGIIQKEINNIEPIVTETKFTGFTDDQKELIKNYESAMSDLGEYLTKLGNGEEISYTSLLSDYPELEDDLDDLNNGIVTLMEKKMEELLRNLPNIPDEVKQTIINQFKQNSGKAPKLSEAYAEISKTFDVVQESIKAFDEGKVTDDVLDNIGGLSERLNNLVAGYHAGIVDISEIYTELKNEYDKDLASYGRALTEKNLDNEIFFGSFKDKNQQFVDDFADTYDIDLKNYSTYMATKKAIEDYYFRGSLTKWNDYYDSNKNKLTEKGKQLLQAKNKFANGKMSTGEYQYIFNDRDVEFFDSIYPQILQGIDAQNELDKHIYESFGKIFEKTKGNGDAFNKLSTSAGDFFDFFERRINVIDKAISKLDAELENVNGSLAKNTIISGKADLVSEKLNNYSSAIAMYQERANAALAKVPEEYRELAKNGGLSLVDFSADQSDIKSKIDDFITWNDKVKDCKEQIAQLQEELRQLSLTQFNNIVEEFDDKFGIFDNSKSLIDKQIALLEESGEVIGSGFYEAQKSMSQKQLSILEDEKEQLVNHLTSALASGAIQQGTDEWFEMMNKIRDVDGSILDCKKSIEELDNAILAVHDKTFERIQNRFKNISDELSNVIELISDMDVSDEKGVWSKEGLTQLGMYANQYEMSTYQIEQYNEELERLNQLYAEGKYSTTEYLDKYAELTSAQWEAVKASESAKKSIIEVNKARIEMIKTGIQKEIDKYKELIKAQQDSLDKEKEAHDYQKSIAEKTSSISKLENQIALLQNDTSAAGIAKRKKLEEELSKAREDLAETEYDHNISARKEALDKQLEDFENTRNKEIEDLENSLKDEETIFKNSLEAIKLHSDTISKEISELAKQHNIELSKGLTDSWKKGEFAIGSYENSLRKGTSSFINMLIGVENEENNLQVRADELSISLSAVFEKRSDDLYNDLNNAFTEADNLNKASIAVHDSLVTALESEYNVSSIVSGLQTIGGELERLISLADRFRIDMNMKGIESKINGDDVLLYNGNNEYLGTFKKSDVDKLFAGRITYSKYAKGIRNNPNNELAWTQELGNELILSPTRNSVLTPLRKGDTVLTKEQTDNMFEWGKMSPEQFRNKIAGNVNLHSNLTPATSSVGLSIGNVLTVNGNIDNNNINEMKQIATSAINTAFKKFSNELKYGKR